MKRSSTGRGSGLAVVKSPAEMRDLARRWQGERASIGLVPTMGALHGGHLSLVERARSENDRLVVSIFVNPIQFGPGEDLDRYPRPVEADLLMLEAAGADAAYMPGAKDMYPDQATTRVAVHGVAGPLEGAARPGHFDGVATVVTKLFWATRADRAYFGQKDAQQVAVVKRLAADLDSGVEIVVCPTVREADGLAVSSRNAYLGPQERAAAASLSHALRAAVDLYRGGERDPGGLRRRMLDVLEGEPLAQVEYAEVVNPGNFSSPGTLAVLAVRIGRTRLIDNHDLIQPYPG